MSNLKLTKNVQIFTSQGYQEVRANTRIIKFQNSLPEDSGLQPGSTVVYTAFLNAKNFS